MEGAAGRPLEGHSSVAVCSAPYTIHERVRPALHLAYQNMPGPVEKPGGGLNKFIGLARYLASTFKSRVKQKYGEGCERSPYVQYDLNALTTGLKLQADGGKLCKLSIQTSGSTSYVELGIPGGCGGDNQPTTLTGLKSGIIVGFQGIADSVKIYQLGFVMLQEIASVVTYTDDINFGDEAPIDTMVYQVIVDNRESGDDQLDTRSYKNYEGEYSYYSEQTVKESYFGTKATLNLNYAKASIEADFELTGEYTYKKSTDTVTENGQNSTSYQEYEKTFCCPAKTKCTWSFYQGYGEFSSSSSDDSATASTKTVVTLKITVDGGTPATITLKNAAVPYTASAYYPSSTTIMVMDPLPSNGNEDTTCGGSSRRKLLGSPVETYPRYKHIEFEAMYRLEGPLHFFFLLHKLKRGGVKKEEIMKRNPWLEKWDPRGRNKADRRIPAGTKVYYKFDNKAYVYPMEKND